MICLFVKERASWILFFVFLQVVVLVMAYLDTSVAFKSAMYTVFLCCIFLSIFLVMRYVKETRFYRDLEISRSSGELTTVTSPFEQITYDQLTEKEQSFKRQLAQLQLSVEQEKDDILQWIHEVKTPLTTMQLMIERVTDQALRSQLHYEWLRIHLLLDQQLHQKRIPFIRNDLSIERADVQKLLAQEIKSLKVWCIQKGIGFEIDLQAQDVLTDSKWLGFIIRQLLTNAVKYSEASDIHIQLATARDVTTLSIEDFGQGIDNKDIPRIFDKGFTGTVNHQNHAATGMGLYLAKQVADSLLITIHVQSIKDKGTLFTLTFPNENDLIRIASV